MIIVYDGVYGSQWNFTDKEKLLLDTAVLYSFYDADVPLFVVGVRIDPEEQNKGHCFLLGGANLKTCRCLKSVVKELLSKMKLAKMFLGLNSLITDAPDEQASKWLRLLGFKRNDSFFERIL